MKCRILSLVCLALLGVSTFACTSATVSPKRSATGEVMLWKHRDYSMRHTGVEYVTGGKYAFTGLMSGKGCYGGLNEAGLGITTNAVRNLVPERAGAPNSFKGHPFSLHVTALRECATVDEFEKLLATYLPESKGHFQTMIGVCDKLGNSAFFEVSNKSYKRFNAQDTEEGFVIRSNFGFSGADSIRGTSTRRYDIMYSQMSSHKAPFKVEDFVGYGKSFNSVKYGNVLDTDDEFIDDNYTVQRNTSCADIIIISGENPRIFICNGNSVVGMVVPLYVGGAIPKCLQMDESMYQNSEEYLQKAYRMEGKNRILNKELVRQCLKANKYKVIDPGVRPENTQKIADKADAVYAKLDRKFKKILAKF